MPTFGSLVGHNPLKIAVGNAHPTKKETVAIAVFIIVNRLAEVTHRQTTALLAASAGRLGQQVVAAEVGAVTARTQDGEIEISIRGLSLPEDTTTSEEVVAFVVPALAGIETSPKPYLHESTEYI